MGKTHWVREKCTLLERVLLLTLETHQLFLPPTGTSCPGPFGIATGQRLRGAFSLSQPWAGIAWPWPQICQCPASQWHPKAPWREKLLLLCFLPALHQQMLSRLMGWQLKKLLQITLKLNIPLSVQYFLHILLTFICVYNCTITFVFWDVHEGNGFQRPI